MMAPPTEQMKLENTRSEGMSGSLRPYLAVSYKYNFMS